MKLFHIRFVLCCLVYCVYANAEVQGMRQPAKWLTISTTTTTSSTTLAPKYSRQTRRSQQSATDENINETKSKSPLLGKSIVDVEDVEKEDHGKQFDHKQRVLLAVESDLKYRGRAKQQERVKSTVSQKEVPDSRKRLKDGIKDLLSKLHPVQPTTTDPILQKSAPTINEVVKRPSKSRKTSTKKPKKQQRRTYLRTLQCEDIPHTEALLHSGLLNNFNNWRGTTQNPMVAQPLVNVREAYEMQRNRLKPHRNQMQFFPAYHSYQPIAWSPNPLPFNSFNVHNPYDLFDCNYFLDPVGDAGAPTVQYMWNEDDDEDVEGQRANSLDTVEFSNDKVLAEK